VNKRDVCGEFPEFCYKAFACEEYAEQFMEAGIFRMGCPFYYKAIEDQSRRDTTEGTGHTLEPGLVRVGWVSSDPEEKTIWTRKQGYQEHYIEQGNPKFCFCTSLPDTNLDYMKKQFGRYIVKIGEPRKLAEEINDYFFDQKQKNLIVGCRVSYNKGQKLHRELSDNERFELPYKQKPESFETEREFRIVAIKLSEVCDSKCKFLDGDAELECKFVEVNLGKQLSCLSRI